jgi:hypothetical protein
MYSYLVPVLTSLNPESRVGVPPEQPYMCPEAFLQQVIPLLITINSSAVAVCAKRTSNNIKKQVFILETSFSEAYQAIYVPKLQKLSH